MGLNKRRAMIQLSYTEREDSKYYPDQLRAYLREILEMPQFPEAEPGKPIYLENLEVIYVKDREA